MMTFERGPTKVEELTALTKLDGSAFGVSELARSCLRVVSVC